MRNGIHCPGVGDITQLVLDELREGRCMQAVRGAAFQKRARALVSRAKPGRKFRPLVNVHEDVYWHWVHREGQECWGDKGFMNDLLRDNEDLRPNVEKDMTRVSFAGAGMVGASPRDREIYLGKTPTKKRYTKKYV